MNEQSSISEIKGIGKKTEDNYHKLGIYTISDLIKYYPRNYDIYEEPVAIGELEEGKISTVAGVIYGRVNVNGTRHLQITSSCIKDDTGVLRVIWFRMPFLKHSLKSGQAIILRGQVKSKKGQILMEHPEIYLPPSCYEEKLHTLQPVYPLTSGVSNNAIMKAVRKVLEDMEFHQEILPLDIRMQHQLVEYKEAICSIHFPKNKTTLFAARERLVFEEFLIFILALRQLKNSEEKSKNPYLLRRQPLIKDFQDTLPFELTNAQWRVWNEIQSDMFGDCTMSRLVQGDVGSGKTIIAVLALLLVGLNGYQGALMAPTEVLAKQHFESISAMLKEHHLPLEVTLLTGSMTAKEKKEIYDRILEGEVQIIIGTHALIQTKVAYKELALVITDEQHRFGVRQRETFANKGRTPHILVMSATPIPRTLAIILYGDLDISVIDELPANRLPIKNCVVGTSYRKTAYEFMKKQVMEGRQCYVICSMVEESEHLDVENVTDYAKVLQQKLGEDVTVGYLHGKMKQSEKDIIMEHFAMNDIQVLVSTTVIEVGINVPNATIMLVENAERFGLAQLHQLRGRVGRGKHQSYCIFMSSSKGKETKERLEILNKSNDGFYIASEDLKLRGPGDLFGIRQSGILDFKLGDVFQDALLLQKASEAATELVQKDPELRMEQHKNLKCHLDAYVSKAIIETTL